MHGMVVNFFIFFRLKLLETFDNNPLTPNFILTCSLKHFAPKFSLCFAC